MNKKSFLPLHKIISTVLFALAAVMAVAYFLALKFDFDFSIAHFSTDSFAFWLFAISAGVAAALAVVLTLACPKNATLSASPAPAPLSLFGGILAVIVSIFVFIAEMKSSREAIRIAKETLGKAQPVLYMQLIGSVMILALAAVIVLSCIEAQRGKTAHKIAAIIAPLSINLTMFARYFDFSQPLNGPVRNVTIMVHCAVLLFLLSEARLAFGDRITARFYVFASSVAASIGLGLSLGGVIWNIVDSGSQNPGESIARLALYVAVGLIAIDRLTVLPKVYVEVEEQKTEENK